MSVEAIITYRCDGPGCDSTVMAESRFDMGPDDWWLVKVAGAAELDMDATLHLCSLPCLQTWLTSQVLS